MPDVNVDFTTLGRWWTPEHPNQRLKGTFEWRKNRGGRLTVDGVFKEFRSFAPGGVGAPTARSIILGTDGYGQPISVLDAIELGESGPLRGRKQASYGTVQVVHGRHIRKWDEFKTLGLLFQFADLPRCFEHTGFDFRHPREEGVTQVRYREKPSIAVKCGDYTLTLNRWVNYYTEGNTYGLTEEANCAVRASVPTHYTTLIDGPVRTLQMLMEFSHLKRLPLTKISLLSRSTRTLPSDLRFVPDGEATPPRRFSEYERPMFTIEELGHARFETLVGRWHAARTELSPALDLFGSLVGRHDIALELRFLLLAYVLEAFHRRTSNPPDVSEKARYASLIRDLVKETPLDLQERVRNLLAPLHSAPLSDRLADLFKRLPDSFLFIGRPSGAFNKAIAAGRDFLTEIVATRNYLTHLNPGKAAVALKGHGLLRACMRLEAMFRFLLLEHLGFTRSEANGAVLSTFQGGLPPGFSTLLR